MNRGPAAARNTGARQANGAYLCFVDEDDVILREYLEVMVGGLESSGAGIATCRAQLFGGKTGIVGGVVQDPRGMLSFLSVVGGGFVVTKSRFFEIGGFDESDVLKQGREDHDWWIRVVAAKVPVHLEAKALYLYRRPLHAKGATISVDWGARKASGQIRQYLFEKYRDTLCLPEEFGRRYIAAGHRNAARALLADGFGREAMRQALAAWRTDPAWQHVKFAGEIFIGCVIGPDNAEKVRRMAGALVRRLIHSQGAQRGTENVGTERV